MNKSKRNIKESRNSNFELMRIISMIFIVAFHVIMRGQFHNDMNGLLSILISFITALIIVHVNSFVIVTGYFQCKSNFKLSKIISINNSVWFYQVVILLIFLAIIHFYPITLAYPITNIDIIKSFIPLDYGLYWYVDIYLLLYIISPYLNKLINTLKKKELEKFILVLFLVFSVISTITTDEVIYTNLGRTIMNFILLYLVGAYLRIYPINKTYLLSKFTDSAKRLIYLGGYIFCAIITTLLHVLFMYCIKFGDFGKFIGNIFNWFYCSFASPFIVIQSVFYFLFFETLNIKNKIINFIAANTLGIYLIHENIYIRDNIYRLLGITKFSTSSHALIIILLSTIFIFTTCLIIEIIRKSLFKFIYNLKISCIFRKWCREYLERLDLKISW